MTEFFDIFLGVMAISVVLGALIALTIIAPVHMLIVLGFVVFSALVALGIFLWRKYYG